MSRRLSAVLLSAGLALLVCQGSLNADEPTDAEKDLVRRCAKKFFDSAESLGVGPVEGWAWPPLVGIADSKEVNAFASMRELKAGEFPKLADHPNVVWLEFPADDSKEKSPAKEEGMAVKQPYIVLLRGFLDTIVQGRETYLAETFGHELGHVLLRHADNYGEGGAPLVATAMTRQQETEADVLGMRLALNADYGYEDLLKAVKSWRDFSGPSSTLAALGQSHPGWTDRVARIARNSDLWTSVSAFENGVFFLASENYLLAERCFTQVTKDFPECYEAWANRGYCRLMRYCDALEPDHLKEISLNHVVVGGFYHRPSSIGDRGQDAQLWYDAYGDFREALRLNPRLILVKANMALAYLVHPNGKDLGRASELFEQVSTALQDEDSSESIAPFDKAAMYVNAGVTELSGGNLERADALFKKAESIYEEGTSSRLSSPLKSAILFSQASRLAASEEKEQRRRAAQQFEEYLTSTSPAISWWTLAYDRYAELCRLEELEIKDRETLLRTENLRYRPVLGVKIENDKTISLNDDVKALTDALGEGTTAPIVRRTNLHRRKYDDSGLEFLCTDRVFAIRLRQAKSPPIRLQASGPGGETKEVRVGMAWDDLLKLLGADATGYDKRFGTQNTVIYHYFPRLGFGVRVTEEGRISEVIVAQIPYSAIVR